MEKDLDEKVSINEFINMWVDAESKLKEKEGNCDNDIKVAHRSKEKLAKIISEYD